MKKCLTLILSISALSISFAFADTVHFKDGRLLENIDTKETEKGVWVSGVLFEKEQISKIEKSPVVKKVTPPPADKPWYDKMSGFLSKLTKKKSTSSADDKARRERINKIREAEEQHAKAITQAALQRARESSQQEQKSIFSSDNPRY